LTEKARGCRSCDTVQRSQGRLIRGELLPTWRYGDEETRKGKNKNKNKNHYGVRKRKKKIPERVNLGKRATPIWGMSSHGPRIAFSQKQVHCLYLECVLEVNKNIKILKDSFSYILFSTEKNVLPALEKILII